MGRPTSLTPELVEKLTSYLRAGVPISHAARASGISEATYHAWRARANTAIENGKVPDTEAPFVEFLELTDTARSEAIARYTLKLNELAMAGDGHSVRFFLSHSDREHWHPKHKAEVEADGEIEVVLRWPD